MDSMLDHELAAFLDSFSLPADPETVINEPIEPTRITHTHRLPTHTETVMEEAVETVTELVELPSRTPSSGNIIAQGVKPTFRPTVVNRTVESGAGRTVAEENMSHVRLLCVFLLVFAVVSVVNAVGLRVYRKYWGPETVSIENSSKAKAGDIVRGRDNRKRARRWRYDMSGFMKRHEVTGEEKRIVQDSEKDWEDVEE